MQGSSNHSSGSCPGWLMTAVAPWERMQKTPMTKALVELGLGDARLIEVQGAFLPMGFVAVPPAHLPMGSLVECHLASSYAYNGSTACAGVAWASCQTPKRSKLRSSQKFPELIMKKLNRC